MRIAGEFFTRVFMVDENIIVHNFILVYNLMIKGFPINF